METAPFKSVALVTECSCVLATSPLTSFCCSQFETWRDTSFLALCCKILRLAPSDLLRDPLDRGSARRKVYVTFIFLVFLIRGIDRRAYSNVTYSFQIFHDLSQASHLLIYIAQFVSVFLVILSECFIHFCLHQYIFRTYSISRFSHTFGFSMWPSLADTNYNLL
jgi:hypothetical protein